MAAKPAVVSYRTEQLIDLRSRKTHRTFLEQINQLLNWDALLQLIEPHYPKGQARTVRKAYPPVLLCKMALLQT